MQSVSQLGCIILVRMTVECKTFYLPGKMLRMLECLAGPDDPGVECLMADLVLSIPSLLHTDIMSLMLTLSYNASTAIL